MKTIKMIRLLFLALMCVAFQSISYGQDTKTIEGKYLEINDEGSFVFIDKSGGERVFDEFDFELEIDLYDDQHFGRTFKVTWSEEEMEEYDDEGEPTGKTKIYRVIVGLQLKQ